MPVDTFIYTVDPYAEEPIMLIDRHIGYDEADGYGIMGDLFQRELLTLDSMDKKRIQVWINSPGGSVTDGYNIYNAILKTKTKVDTYCSGIAASIAAVIFQAGRTRSMADYSKLMFHNPFGTDDNKALDAIRDSLIKMIANRCSASEEEVGKMMNRTTWMGADEALDAGYCDEVHDSGAMNKKRAIKTLEQARALWSDSNKILNSIFNTENSSSMKKVANKLKLNPEATEDSIVSEIEKIENSAKAASDAVAKKEEEMKRKQEELDKAQADLKALQAKVKELEDAKAKADLDAKNKADAEKAIRDKEIKDKAEKLITGFVDAGRIKNDADQIKKWTAQAEADYEATKALIEGLPVNGKAVKIDQVNNSGKKIVSAVAAKMIELQARGSGVTVK